MDITAKSMQEKFPALAGAQPVATIEFAIEEARRHVDQTWVPGDQIRAMMWYTAHLLALGVMTGESGTGQMVSSENITGLGSQTYVVAPWDACLLETTIYGRRYLELLKLSFGGGLVV